MPEHLTKAEMLEIGTGVDRRREERRSVWTMVNPEADRRVWDRRRYAKWILNTEVRRWRTGK